MRLTGSILTVSAMFALCLSGCGSSDDSMRFEADPYRTQIEAIEQHIASEPTPTHGSTLGVLATDLAGELGKNIDNQRYRETIQVRLISFGDIFAMAEQQGAPFESRPGEGALAGHAFGAVQGCQLVHQLTTLAGRLRPRERPALR